MLATEIPDIWPMPVPKPKPRQEPQPQEAPPEPVAEPPQPTVVCAPAPPEPPQTEPPIQEPPAVPVEIAADAPAGSPTDTVITGTQLTDTVSVEAPAGEEAVPAEDPEPPVPNLLTPRKASVKARMDFMERMDEEGRGQEFRQRIRDFQGKGLGWVQATWAAMREFGYISAKEQERQYKAKLLSELKAQARQEVMGSEEVKEAKRDRKRKSREKTEAISFDMAMQGVPPTASPSEELDWVRAHPAMMRKSRSGTTGDVHLRVEDILHAPHGKAPSRAAVAMLMHWCNNVSEFHKMVLNEHKKKQEKGGDNSKRPETELDMIEVERLLKEVSGV